MNEVQLRKLILQAEQLWKMRFDRAIELVRMYHQPALADIISAIKRDTFEVVTELPQIQQRERAKHWNNAILDSVRVRGNSKSSQIVKDTGIPYSTVYNTIINLMGEGKLIKHGTGNGTYYTVPVVLREVV